MAEFLIQKWDRLRFPNIVKEHDNKEVYAVYYVYDGSRKDVRSMPLLIGKTLTEEAAISEAKWYSSYVLHCKNPKIEMHNSTIPEVTI